MKLSRWLCLLGAVSIAGCTTHLNKPEQPTPLRESEFEERLGVRYSPDDWPQTLHADLFVVQRRNAGPAVLVVHGGSWQSRSRKDMRATARDLARRGFTAMAIDYRFAPEYQYPAQLRDLQQALDWLREHHQELAVDPDRIAGLGFSAGAHLVSLLAAVTSSDHPDKAPWNPQQDSLVAVVVGGLPADLRAFGSGRLLRELLGGTQEEVPERYRRASPAAWVTPAMPPHFLFHGTWDNLVPVQQSRDFYQQLREAGVPGQLYLMHGHGHATSFLFRGYPIHQGMHFLEHYSYPDRVNQDAETVPATPPE